MQLNIGLSPLDKRVQETLNGNSNFDKSGITFTEFCQHFQNDILPLRNLSAATITSYRYFLKKAIQSFGKHDINQVTLSDISRFLQSSPPRQSNSYRSMFCVLYKYAVAEGLVSENLPTKTIKFTHIVKRQRLTFEGFAAIKKHAPNWLKNAMDLALITGQRVGDIAQMKHSDIKNGFLHIKQSKTSNSLKIPIIEQLLEIVSHCTTDCDYLISIKNKQITSSHISKSFCKVRKESGFYSNIEHPPTFHEIRALSAYLQQQSGVDKKTTQNWLGHTTVQMTNLYLSRREENYQEISTESITSFSQLLTL